MYRFITFSLIYLLVSPQLAATQKSVNTIKKCSVNLSVGSSATTSQKGVEIAPNQYMYIETVQAKQTINDHRMAKVANCQRLTGINYSGSAPEWQSYFNRSIQALADKGFTKIDATAHVGDKALYKGLGNSKEVSFIATNEQSKQTQLIKILAVLDKNSNTLYSVSVSGAITLQQQIQQSYQHLVAKFALPAATPYKLEQPR